MPDAGDSIVQTAIANTLIGRGTFTIVQDGTAQTGAAGYMPVAGDIVACVFFNNNTTSAFTAAAKIAVTGGDVALSSATLAKDAVERISTGLTNNTGLAKAAKVTLTTGTDAGATGPTVAIVEYEYKINTVA